MMYRGDYLLVKAGLDAGRRQWFGVPLPEPPEGEGEAHVPQESEGNAPVRPERAGKRGAIFGLFHGAGVRRTERGRKQEGEQGQEREGRREQRRERRRQEEAAERYRQRLTLLEDAVEQTARRLKQALDEVDGGLDIHSVYELELAFLAGEEGIAGIWGRCWGMPEFRDYRAPRWAVPLAEQAVGPHFVLLGTAEAVPEVLGRCAGRMKSLRWILPAEEWDAEAQDLAEDFYEEYGLAISPEPWTGGRASLRLSEGGPPVCVLDFAGGETAYGGVLPEGSVWIDFCSAEEMERRFLRRKTGVNYVSLKKYWRECRRRDRVRVKPPVFGNAETVPRFHKYSAFLDSR